MALFTHLVSIGITFMVAFVEELADDMRVYGAAIGATATTGQSFLYYPWYCYVIPDQSLFFFFLISL